MATTSEAARLGIVAAIKAITPTILPRFKFKNVGDDKEPIQVQSTPSGTERNFEVHAGEAELGDYHHPLEHETGQKFDVVAIYPLTSNDDVMRRQIWSDLHQIRVALNTQPWAADVTYQWVTSWSPPLKQADRWILVVTASVRFVESTT
jgi:hypothetical protein